MNLYYDEETFTTFSNETLRTLRYPGRGGKENVGLSEKAWSKDAATLAGNAKISAVRSLADICFLHVLIRLIRCIIVSVCASVFKWC